MIQKNKWIKSKKHEMKTLSLYVDLFSTSFFGTFILLLYMLSEFPFSVSFILLLKVFSLAEDACRVPEKRTKMIRESERDRTSETLSGCRGLSST